MKVDENDFRRRYAELSDQGLLSINPEDLVDAARQCYHEELARRGLQAEQELAKESEGIDDEFVSAAAYLFPDEAGIARALLRSADILCYLANEHTLTAVWTWSYVLGGLRLMVPASRIEHAQEILHETLSEGEYAAESGMEPQIGSTEENTRAIHGGGRIGWRFRVVLAMALLCSPSVEFLRLFYV